MCISVKPSDWGDQAATPDDYLYMATAGGAKVLGRDDIGYLAPGMAADFTVMDWNQLTYAGGCYDPVACIVESGDPRLVKRCSGKMGELVVSSGKLTKVNEEEKRDYTLILKGHIALAMAKFPVGTRGAQLDVLARMPIWKYGMNFLHGTGHGVGHFLSVHEGPQSIRMNENLSYYNPAWLLPTNREFIKPQSWHPHREPDACLQRQRRYVRRLSQV